MTLDIKAKIIHIEDWPTKGISYTDTSRLLADPEDFNDIITKLAEPYQSQKIDKVVGIEARGFLLAGALALKLGAGAIMIRKKGKLPAPRLTQEYSYEYSSSAVEISRAALQAGERVVLVDDVLATGASAAAAVKLLKELKADIIGISCIVVKSFLAPQTRLKGQNINFLVDYA